MWQQMREGPLGSVFLFWIGLDLDSPRCREEGRDEPGVCLKRQDMQLHMALARID